MSNISSSLLAEQIYNIAEKYEFYTSVIIMSGGLISNIFIILILTNLRIFRGNQCAFYLIIECFSNIGLLSIILSSRISAYILGIDPVHLIIIWCKIRSWATQVFGLISLLTISFATFDQYLSTNSRYSLRQMSTIKLAYRLTFFNITFSILYNIPLLILTNIQSSNGCAVYNLIFKNYFSFFYYPIVASSLPVIVTSTFSLLAYRNVRHIIRRQIPIDRRRLDKQLTAMILARVICLLSLGLPFIIYTLSTSNIPFNQTNQLNLAIARLIDAIILSLFYANYSINFYIFLLISSRFRHQTKYFLTKKIFYCIRTHQIVPKNVQHPISIINLE